MVQISTAFMIFFSIFGRLSWPLSIFVSVLFAAWGKPVNRNGKEKEHVKGSLDGNI